MTENTTLRNIQTPLKDGSSIRRLSSNELFAGHSRLRIEHAGTEYHLQITRQGKLILTK